MVPTAIGVPYRQEKFCIYFDTGMKDKIEKVENKHQINPKLPKNYPKSYHVQSNKKPENLDFKGFPVICM